MKKDIYLPLGVSLLAVLALLQLAPSPWIKVVFIFFLILSLLFYFQLFRADGTSSLLLAQGYFVALAVQCIHFIEEYVGEIYIRLPELFDLPPIKKDDFVLFNLGAYAVFILGGIALFRNYRRLMVIPIFFVLLGVMANGIIHVLLALWTSSYFPGLYTALIYLILGPYLIGMLRGNRSLTANGS